MAKTIKHKHTLVYDYSTPAGDWYVCTKCGYKELQKVK